MDSGAHFHRCDFQVHTPRDPQWHGPRPTTADERRAFAERFVAACREKGLQAVAITDHHDLALFPAIKQAAQNEKDAAGDPLPEEERLVVFPGMELTLGVPCQALLILDADFDVSLLSQVPRILGITAAPEDNPTHAEVQVLEAHTDLRELAKLLNGHDFLRHRYILLPNVTDGGHKTLIRAGFNAHYANMPCVGGYADGDVSTYGTGFRRITNGEDPNYGSRKIGIFQTSDSRRDDFTTLGETSTWVKWAQPTAEALRQACLARDTRIFHEPPRIPPLIIRRLHVSNSKFLGPTDLELNEQFNCLIGGRGTGKSTVLEYLRWALCDQPPDLSETEDVPDFQARRAQLIANTLAPYDGVVTVRFELNGVPHAVRRKASPPQLLIKIGDEEFRECSEQEIRTLLPVQAYSQKQLSSVGVRDDELLRLIHSPIKAKLAEFRREEVRTLELLRAAAESRHAKRNVGIQIARESLELQSLEQQLKKLRESLKGVSEGDQNILNEHTGYEAEQEVVSFVDSRLEAMRAAAGELRREIELAAFAMDADPENATPNAELLARLIAAYATVHSSALSNLDTLEQQLRDGPGVSDLTTRRGEWQALDDQHSASYEQAKSGATTQQSMLQQMNDTEARRKRLSTSIANRKDELARLGDPETGFANRLAEWKALSDRRSASLDGQCSSLTSMSDQRIRATLDKGTDTSAIGERILELLTGTRIRTKKVEDLCEYLAAHEEGMATWFAVSDELWNLVYVDADATSEAELPDAPILTRCGFTAGDLLKIARKLRFEQWVTIALTGLGDVPVFEYQLAEGDFIPFRNASAGQQATALLHVLLKQEGPPLLIDQLEEDIDNQVVLEIVSAIWEAKSNRQLIFSSHNANVVVNGDADLVVICEYRNAGDHSGGRIEKTGAIDVTAIRSAITRIMEGGEEAFKLRQKKYGF